MDAPLCADRRQKARLQRADGWLFGHTAWPFEHNGVTWVVCVGTQIVSLPLESATSLSLLPRGAPGAL